MGLFFRMGDTAPRQVDVRLIAASNRKLPALIEEGLCRSDLYYRLKVVEIDVPPLRERHEDVPLPANHFIEKNSRKFGKKVEGLTTAALGALMRYPWPGNVRELEDVIQRMIIMGEAAPLDADVLPAEILGIDKSTLWRKIKRYNLEEEVGWSGVEPDSGFAGLQPSLPGGRERRRQDRPRHLEQKRWLWLIVRVDGACSPQGSGGFARVRANDGSSARKTPSRNNAYWGLIYTTYLGSL